MLSVVVPAYNEEEHIEECLLSLNNQSCSDYEIIVVVGGEDNTLKLAKKHARVLPDEKEKGAGPARNQGAARARGEVLVFTDADTVVPYGWVEKYEELFQDPEVVAAGGPVKASKGNGLDKTVYKVNLDWFPRFTGALGFYQLSGANCAYRKQAFMRAHGFNEEMSMLEDTEFCNRIKNQGKVVFDKNNPCFSSPRRMKDQGYVSVFFKFLKEYFRFYVEGKNPKQAYFASAKN